MNYGILIEIKHYHQVQGSFVDFEMMLMNLRHVSSVSECGGCLFHKSCQYVGFGLKCTKKKTDVRYELLSSFQHLRSLHCALIRNSKKEAGSIQRIDRREGILSP